MNSNSLCNHLKTLPEAFRDQAEKSPQKAALILPSTDPDEAPKTITFAEADRLIDQYARGLIGFGLKRGDRVAVRLEKSGASLLLFFAILRIGCVYVPINPAYTYREAAFLIEDSDPVLLIDNDGTTGLLPADTETHRCEFMTGGPTDLTLYETEEPFEELQLSLDNVAAILFTSGTTGQPKGAPLTHRNLMSNAVELAKLWDISPSDRVLHVLPIFHAHGLFIAAAMPLVHGAGLIVLPKFKADVVITHLPEATVLMAVPEIYTRLLAHDGFKRTACTSLRLITVGSAPLSPETFYALKDRTGLAVVERYGLTETNILTSNSSDGTARVGSVGRLLPGVDLHIVDSYGDNVAAGSVGRIMARGPAIIQRYWSCTDQDSALSQYGFFDTGDLGRMDEEGFLWLAGRSKDLIISGGFNVYPREVEIVIESLPEVEEVVVFGVAHPDFGEAVVAAVKLHKGIKKDADSIENVIRKNLARYKQPKKIIFVSKFPRNSMRKVLKTKLREEFSDTFQ